jgi:excisionase family DNA binding protein
MTHSHNTRKAPSHKRLVDLNEAAAYASCCRETIRRRIADGTLHGYRLGTRLLRVDLNEIDAALTPVLTDREWLRATH